MANPGASAEERKAAVEQLVLAMVEENISLRQWCARENMSIATVLRWVDEAPALAEQYARAHEARGFAYADKIDEIDALLLDGTIDASSHRTLVDGLKWRAARMARKSYGDKVDVTSGGQAIPTTFVIGVSRVARIEREAEADAARTAVDTTGEDG